MKWKATDGKSFFLIREYIDKRDPSIISYFKKYRNDGNKKLIDKHGNEIDFLHLLATLGGQRHIEIDMGIWQDDTIDPNLSGWAGDLQSFIYNLKVETYGKGLNSEKLNDTAYDMFTGNIEVNKNKFSNEDLLSDVDAKNIHENYDESCNLSVALRNYYVHYTNERFAKFVSYYGGFEKFKEIVGSYTEGNDKIKHMILHHFAKKAAEIEEIQNKYKASYEGTILGVNMYLLPNPKTVTQEESIALKEGFCQWISQKLEEEKNIE